MENKKVENEAVWIAAVGIVLISIFVFAGMACGC
jgi:hypothetical protein